MMHNPKVATALKRVRPVRRNGGSHAIAALMTTAPMAGAARESNPSPEAPMCRISSANTGSSAVAPPNSTEKRSRDSAPRTTGSLKTKRTPVARLFATASVYSRLISDLCAIMRIALTPKNMSTATTEYVSVVPPAAYRTPPTAGPITDASCHDPLLHVIAFP